jgi:hypothetical protein
MVKSGKEGVLIDFSRRFGMIAVNRGYVTPEQLKEALAEQIDSDLACRPHQLLGMILYEKGLMSLTQIDQVLDEIIMDKIKQKESVSKK